MNSSLRTKSFIEGLKMFNPNKKPLATYLTRNHWNVVLQTILLAAAVSHTRGTCRGKLPYVQCNMQSDLFLDRMQRMLQGMIKI